MSDSVEFLRTAHATYVNANHDALLWQLDRVHDVQPWINSKCKSITLQDYDESDGLRGPQYTYGWILLTAERFFCYDKMQSK